MSIIRMRAERSGANLMIFSGRITPDELLAQFGAVDETQDETSNNWLILDLGSADISELNFDTLAKLKSILAPKMTVMKARRAFEVVIVGLKPLNDPIYMSWKSFVGADKTYPSDPLLCSDLKTACEHLGYGGAECAELIELCAVVR